MKKTRLRKKITSNPKKPGLELYFNYPPVDEQSTNQQNNHIFIFEMACPRSFHYARKLYQLPVRSQEVNNPEHELLMQTRSPALPSKKYVFFTPDYSRSLQCWSDIEENMNWPAYGFNWLA